MEVFTEIMIFVKVGERAVPLSLVVPKLREAMQTTREAEKLWRRFCSWS